MDLAISPLLFFDPDSGAERRRRRVSRIEDASHRKSRLYCTRCHHAVTDEAQRIDVNGAFVHTCTNPHGITFHIGCFREASGCTALEAATTEHTWFRGYAWRIAHCARCDTHLGWLFTSPSDGFYGLIVDRLTSTGE